MTCPSETRLQAFVDGALAPSEIDALSEHLDGCDECRALVGAVQPVQLDEGAADHVGRYVLRRVLGKGGMGVVYEAVDPELHRVVALKVLRSDLGAQQQRLLAEAQAMAKLSHPNVVTIHDVGRAGERVFIVMALVEGTSLRHWLAREQRPIGAILDAFEQAAEGLAAAHDAGLVHRDFKPENVFVANDGRVLVGDFGLAVSLDASTSDAAGSLAYMAPEQKRGEKVDARSDQYGFCLALDEAAKTAPAAPRWLAKIVARGTQGDPSARFASMRAVLDAIRAGRSRSRGRRAAAAVAIAAIAVAIGGLLWMRAKDAPDVAACRAREAEMSAIWNADVAKKTEGAFRATNSPLADRAWKSVSTALDAYAEAWRGAHRRTCEVRRPHDPAAIAAAEQKKSCLVERLEIARAVATSFEHVDGPMLEQVPAMLQLLPRVGACEDAREIAQRAPPPPPEKAAAVADATKKIATVSATLAAGRYAEGLTLADDAWQSANRVGFLPLLADAYLWLGVAHGRLGHAKESEQALEQAASSASAGRATATAIRAWIQLMHFVGFEGKRYEDGFRYATYAKSALESMPGEYELEAERLAWSRAMLVDQKKLDEALVVSREELALVELRFGASDRRAATALDGLAGILAGQCKTRDAIEPQEKACAILEKEYGSPHPQLALCLGNLAALRANLGEHARALVEKDEALAMFERVPGHPNHVAMARRNEVRSLIELGRVADAEEQLVLAERVSKRDSEQVMIAILRGDLRRREGKTMEAIEAHASAVGRTEHAEPARRIEPLVALAESDLAAGKWADAESNAERAVGFAKTVYGESSCRVAPALRVQAEALEGAGRAGDALPLAERALALAKAAQIDPLVVAHAEIAVAVALPPADHERARALATSAREAASRDPTLLQHVDAWLASHP